MFEGKVGVSQFLLNKKKSDTNPFENPHKRGSKWISEKDKGL